MFMKMNRRFQGVPEAWTQGMPQHFWDAPALPGLGEQQPGITQQRTPVLPYDMPPNVAQIQPQAPDLSYLNQPLSRAEKIQEVEAAMGRARAAMPPPSYEMLRKSTLNPNNEAVMRMLRDQGGAEYQNYIAEGGTLDDLRRKSRQMVLEREFTTRFPEGRMGGPGSVGGPYGTVRGGPKLRQAQELRGIRRGRVTPEEVRVRRQMRGAPDLSLEDLSAFVPPELKARRDYMQNLANAPELMMGGGTAPYLEQRKTIAEIARLGEQTRESGARADYWGKMPQAKEATDDDLIAQMDRIMRYKERVDKSPDSPKKKLVLDLIKMQLQELNSQLAGRKGMQITEREIPARKKTWSEDWWGFGETEPRTEYQLNKPEGEGITAINPQTGERVISYDRGQTWQRL